MAKGDCLVQAPLPVGVCSQHNGVPNSPSDCQNLGSILLRVMLPSHLYIQVLHGAFKFTESTAQHNNTAQYSTAQHKTK